MLGPLAHLRSTVRRYARDLRARGACREQVRVQVRALVVAGLAAEAADDPALVRRLTAAVVHWGLAAFDIPAERP